jgi:tetraacyldisaccharide-1-P 4'-kinase
LVGVIDYYLGDEPLLLAFAAHAGIQPTDVAAARRALAPEEEG